VPKSPLHDALNGKAKVAFASRHATPSSKTATPELHLLEAAAQELDSLDELHLLPAAAIDCSWADCSEDIWPTPATTAPHTGLCVSPLDGDLAESEEEEEEGEDRADSTEEMPRQLRAFPAVSLDPVEVSAGYEAGSYVAMWCWTHKLEDSQMLIVPFAEGDAEEPPVEDAVEGSCAKLWCWVQPADEAAGTPVLVVPFTDKGAALEPEDAGTGDLLDVALGISPKAEEVGPLPLQGGHEPAWKYGPCYPFCRKPTTLKLSGLPKDFEQEDLLELLDREEFSGCYDFVYLPSQAQAEAGLADRHALVNLTKHTYALALASRLHSKTSMGGKCGSPLVAWSLPCQGQAELVQVYRNVPVNRSPDEALEEEEELPQLFAKGWPVRMPPPTREGLFA